MCCFVDSRLLNVCWALHSGVHVEERGRFIFIHGVGEVCFCIWPRPQRFRRSSSGHEHQHFIKIFFTRNQRLLSYIHSCTRVTALLGAAVLFFYSSYSEILLFPVIWKKSSVLNLIYGTLFRNWLKLMHLPQIYNFFTNIFDAFTWFTVYSFKRSFSFTIFFVLLVKPLGGWAPSAESHRRSCDVTELRHTLWP